MVLLVLPFLIAEAAFWLFLVYAVVRAFKALIQKRFLAVSIWLAIFAAPFVLFYERNAEADRREAARAREVASFERHAVPQTYPRVLEVHGFVADLSRLILLDVLKIDEIMMFETSPRAGGRGQRLSLAEGCRGRGRRYLDEMNSSFGTVHISNSDKSCILSQIVDINIDIDKIESILLLHDNHTTLKLPGPYTGGGNYEIRIKTKNRNLLIDYWERPHITRPSWPGPIGYLAPQTPGWREYPNPGWLNFVLRPFGVFVRE